MENAELLAKVTALIEGVSEKHNTALETLKKTGAVPSELTEQIKKMGDEILATTNIYNDQQKKLDEAIQKNKELETKMKGLDRFERQYEASKSLGERFIESAEFKEMMENRRDTSRKFQIDTLLGQKVDSFLSSGNAGDILTEPQRLAGIQNLPNVPLTVRSILPVGRTGNNSIEYVRENVFTNNAGPQFSPASPQTSPPTYVFDSALKNKSLISWTLVNTPVRTIAHYMKASRQILDDAPMLQSEINNRLMYGLAIEEEEQLLLGDGNNGNMLGLVPQAADYNTGLNVANDTKIDKIRHALLQVTLAKYLPTAIVLNHQDWHDIELIKTEDGAVANKGAYILSNPASLTAPRLWGYRVVPSLSMTAGRFLVGNFATGAQIFDRMNASVEIARQNEDDFVRNMISILAEERVALAVYVPTAFVEGAF